MTFLPIVERELRVAARRRGTFWLRMAAVLAAVCIGGGFLALNQALEQTPFELGKALFNTVTWLAFPAVAAAGLFFTADALSEEKREGTLGLLFLTDLRGHDVVLGKLAVSMLRTLYPLLAILPVLAVSLLLGGVSGGEFWRKALALTNTLFFSLTAGMFVSSISRDAHRALTGTVLVILLFVAVLPAADAIWGEWRGGGFAPLLSYLSPGFNFVTAERSRAAQFWTSLAGVHLLGWVFLITASLLVARNWQERSKRGDAAARTGWRHRWEFGSGPSRAARRRKLLDRNPVLWLVFRQRWQGVLAWALVVPWVAVVIWLMVENHPQGIVAYLGGFGTGIVGFIFYLWMASQASRFFVEARRSGSVELLLASPLNSAEIVRGQWMALRRIFGWPVVLLLVVRAVVAFMQTENYSGAMRGGVGEAPGFAMYLITALAAPLVMVADLLALGWVGMWMGLTSRNVNFATLKTIAFVLIIPWFAGSFISGISVALVAFRFGVVGGGNPMFVFLFSQLVGTGFYVAKDIFFIWLARKRVYADLRETAARAVMPIRATHLAVSAPPVPTAQNAPPVIRDK